MRAIDHVGLTVADLDRAVEFWCGRLGLRLLGRVTETGPDIAALIGEDSVELEIADLDAALERIQGSQARQISRHPVVLHDPGGAWDGVACCYIADPDGNMVELVQR